MGKPRARDLGLDFPGTTGPDNAITDVPGVRVGYSTIMEGEGALVVGEGPVRTGVTAILPRGRTPELMPIWAGFSALNGNGEMTGSHWIEDAGYFLSPIFITNTHSVGMVHHAATKWMLEAYAGQFQAHHLWAMPVVAETYDGRLNDINGQHVHEAHVFEALDGAAAGPLREGNVGGGTGMVCYGFKGGTGTASRRLELGAKEYNIGALVQANHGRREWLTILGVPVGRHLPAESPAEPERGSIIVILGTDIPMLPHQLRRLAKRGAIGIGRHGTPGGNGSGDIFLAFSVANPMGLHQLGPAELRLDFVNDEAFDAIYLGAVEAIEEAVVNALVAAEDMTSLKPPGELCKAIDPEALVALMRHYQRCR
jgi:D-aminopeptidase